MTIKVLFIFLIFPNLIFSQLGKDDRKKMRQTIKWISEFDIRYSKTWTPPDTSKPVRFDCSGTVQYIFSKALNFSIPRDSFSQYVFFKEKEFYSDPPMQDSDTVNTDELRKNLRFGDVLFWTNTYNIPPGRNPPISHVMIYVGRDKKGVMKMAGANTWGNGYFTSSGGPDVYIFDPNQILGCVREVEGDRKSRCIKQGQFVGFGRFIKN